MKKLSILAATLLMACYNNPDAASTMPANTTASGTSGDTWSDPSAEGTDSSTTAGANSGHSMPEGATSMDRTGGAGTEGDSAGWDTENGGATGPGAGSDTLGGRAPGTGIGDDMSAGAQQGGSATSATPMAEANLVDTKDGSAVGTVTFRQQGSTINVSGTITGLPPGPLSVSIYDGGNCTKKGTLIGKPFAPTGTSAGASAGTGTATGTGTGTATASNTGAATGTASGSTGTGTGTGTATAGGSGTTGTTAGTATASNAGTASALGNVVADAEGNATVQLTSRAVVLDEGAQNSIVRKAIVIHAKGTSKTKASAPIACGVIEASGDDVRSTAAPSATTRTRTLQ